MGDGVSTLDEFNSRYKKWVTNGKISQGSAGSCNASSLYDAAGVVSGSDPKRGHDYYLCGDKDGFNCKGLEWSQWDSLFGNCKRGDEKRKGEQWDKVKAAERSAHGKSSSHDPCLNQAWLMTEGVVSFSMGGGGSETSRYDPITDSGCPGDVASCNAADRTSINAGDCEAGGYYITSDCESNSCDTCHIGDVAGMRPAYVTDNSVVYDMDPDGHNADVRQTDDLENCPTGYNRITQCALNGWDVNTYNATVKVAEGVVMVTSVAAAAAAGGVCEVATLGGCTPLLVAATGAAAEIAVTAAAANSLLDSAPGCGTKQGGNTGRNVSRFCARDYEKFSDNNIAKCCLGSLANGPEVDTSGNPISNDYKNCPREYCTSRIAEGTGGGGGTNCDNPVTDGTDASGQPEMYCNKMSNTCDQFFHDKCTEVVFNDETHELHQNCKDWGHIQPDSFRTIAHEICNIGDFSGTTRPSQDEVSHVKQVMDTPLCREYILENLQTEKTKLKDLCSHYMIKNDEDEWVPNVLLNVDGVDLLQNICPCYYPDEFYNSYRSSLNREVGTCSDPDGNVDSTIRSRQECENKEGENTWDTDAGQSNLVAAIDDRMAIHPECYYPECTSSLLYNIEESSCSMNLNLCYQQLTQQNIILGDDKIDTSNVDLTSGQANQTCNQSTLLSDPPPSDSGGGGGGEGLFSGLGSFLGGDDDDDGSGSGGGDNSTMIIIIVIVIIIIIIGVVAVIMLNKGDPNPPAQQPGSQ